MHGGNSTWKSKPGNLLLKSALEVGQSLCSRRRNDEHTYVLVELLSHVDQDQWSNNNEKQPGVVVHIFNLSAQEAEGDGSLSLRST